MKLKYLGTAAYEGIPAVFCDCPVCRKARELGGKELKTRQQALLNDEVMFDFGPDTLMHTHVYAIDWTKIHNVLITHTHSDHFYIKDWTQISSIYSHQENKHVNIYGGSSLIEMLNTEYAHPKAQEEHHKISTWTEVHEGEMLHFDGYDVMPINANHAPKTTPFIYAVRKDGKAMLYGHDTSMLSDESFECLKTFGHLDMISLDCDGGYEMTGWYSHHMTLDVCLEFIERLEKLGVIDDKTIKVVSHVSHNSNALHCNFQKVCDQYGILVAYDGMEVEF